MKLATIGPAARISARDRIRPVLNFTCNSPAATENSVSLVHKQLPDYDSPNHDLLNHDLLKNAKDRAVAR